MPHSSHTDNDRPTTELHGQRSCAASGWHLLGSPLRPAAEDVAAMQRVIGLWCRDHAGEPPRGLILGVTPEIHNLAWPDRTLIRAVDRDPEMAKFVWPGDPQSVIRADWREAFLPPHSTDIAFCDGGLQLLAYPHDQQRMIENLARIVAPGGFAVFRLFTPSPVVEDVEAVLRALEDRRIPSLNHLKLRLWSALQDNPTEGVCLADVWTALRRLVDTDWQELADRLHWDVEHLAMIDAYHECAARYHLITLGEATQLFSAQGFRRVSTVIPNYPLGRHCPTVVFARD